MTRLHRASIGGLVIALGFVLSGAAMAKSTIDRAPFGTTPQGEAVEAITLSAGQVSATIITYGARVQSVRAPDRAGDIDDVVLGFDDLAGYVADKAYLGAMIGRYANRIAGGRFVLDGTAHQVTVNNGSNSLHGGTAGFDKAVWSVVSIERGAKPSVTLRHVSVDGDQGYPGTLTATATFSLDKAGSLAIVYHATTDAPTIVNMTNHSYWRLAGLTSRRSALDALLTIPAQTYLPVDAGLIPTGERRLVAGTAFDFGRATAIDERLRDGSDDQLRLGRGYDHNWIVADESAGQRLVARLQDRSSGRMLEVFSDQPGVQFYSGNFLDGTVVGKGGRIFRQGDAVCLEPQRFPDTPNQPAFGSARLAPGEAYEHRLTYRVTVAD